jgi:poly-beta-hydroxyalkanoate depolymerase
MCNVEKNGFIDKDIQTREKNKVLQVFRISKSAKGGEEQDLRFMLKYQKSMDLALEFHLKDINGVFS